MAIVGVSGSFDDLRSRHVRFLEEAAKLGDVHVALWSDEAVEAMEGRSPKFPQNERLYFVESMRYVRQVTVVDGAFDRDEFPAAPAPRPDIWAVDSSGDSPARKRFCEAHGLKYEVIPDERLSGFPNASPQSAECQPGRKKVIVTGCYDWLHTGHVRFFEEVAEYGDLYVSVGHDANIKLLKGPGHPQFNQDERRYMVQAIRYVKEALIATGSGWLDAEPEIRRIRPDIYAVNEDGDRPEKQRYCQEHGIDYLVLKRLPKTGLARRYSTALRGF
jgi:cytidyltransferase-like protein